MIRGLAAGSYRGRLGPLPYYTGNGNGRFIRQDLQGLRGPNDPQFWRDRPGMRATMTLGNGPGMAVGVDVPGDTPPWTEYGGPLVFRPSLPMVVRRPSTTQLGLLGLGAVILTLL